MQVVIMAAGKSTRTYPLTLTRPKPLLPVLNRPMIYYNLDQLVGLVDEVILIVGYRKEMIEDQLGREYRGMKLVFLEQKEQLGTGHAVLQAAHLVKGRFIVMNGDDIFARKDIEKLIQYPYSALVMEVENPSQYGVAIVDKDGNLTDFVEKPKTYVSNLTNVGCYVLEPEIFSILEKTPLSERGEIELPTAILTAAEKYTVKVITLTGYWMPTGFPWDLLKMQRFLFDYHWQKIISGKVEEGAIIHGNVQIGEGSIIRSGVHILGPTSIGRNCEIDAFSYIGPYTSLGNDVKIGVRCTIGESIIMPHSEIEPGCIVRHSILGSHVNVGENCHFISRLPGNSFVQSIIKEKILSTNLSRFGAALGDDASLGARTTIFPGCKLWPGVKTEINQIVKNDLIIDS